MAPWDNRATVLGTCVLLPPRSNSLPPLRSVSLRVPGYITPSSQGQRFLVRPQGLSPNVSQDGHAKGWSSVLRSLNTVALRKWPQDPT